MLGQAKARVLEGDVDCPLLFVEKQVIAVTIQDTYLDYGDRTPLPYTACEVYAPTEQITQVCTCISLSYDPT